MTPTPEQIEAWARLAEGASPAPWIRSGVRQKLRDVDCLMVGPDEFLIAAVPIGTDNPGAFRDAGFIAASRTAVPSLITLCKSQAEELAALRERVAKVLQSFAIDAESWSETVPNEHRSLCTEPGSDYAHPGSEAIFTVGDLRAARSLHIEMTGGKG